MTSWESGLTLPRVPEAPSFSRPTPGSDAYQPPKLSREEMVAALYAQSPANEAVETMELPESGGVSPVPPPQLAQQRINLMTPEALDDPTGGRNHSATSEVEVASLGTFGGRELRHHVRRNAPDAHDSIRSVPFTFSWLVAGPSDDYTHPSPNLCRREGHDGRRRGQ